ncbi:beta-1,4-N-acetylgalactosaminyltransferase bre-4-like [Macrobrachium rosenbergii]|uniref:beta-1,4-N-acetylgalactosaminyltransferase bre-4-like n=1 Tax=Macrobrachium rosenbergii TaxID=79674 RepID=UPI0034D4269F
MNVGTVEALKIYNYQCFIFHDIDLLPENDKNIYACPDQPRHMSAEVNTLRYTIPAPTFVGGVLAISVDQFKTVNGYSNKFLGWGGEDDDMSNRILASGLFVTRYPPSIGRYTMIHHKKSKPSPNRFQNVEDGKSRFRTDGLNSMNYKTLEIQLRPLYTWVYVDVYPS